MLVTNLFNFFGIMSVNVVFETMGGRECFVLTLIALVWLLTCNNNNNMYTFSAAVFNKYYDHNKLSLQFNKYPCHMPIINKWYFTLTSTN